MQKNTIFGVIIGLAIGLAAGFWLANTLNKNAALTAQNQNVSNFPPSQPQQPSVAVQSSQNAMMPVIAETLDRAQKEPDNFETQVRAGDLHAQIQKFDKAIEFYEKAHRIKPDDYQILVKIGNTYFDSNQFEQAEKWYLKALEKNPDDSGVRTDLGVTFVERPNADLDRAIKEFQTSMEKAPRSEPTIYNLGVAYYKKGNLEEAQKTLKKLEEINPQSQLAGRLKQVLAK